MSVPISSQPAVGTGVRATAWRASDRAERRDPEPVSIGVVGTNARPDTSVSAAAIALRYVMECSMRLGVLGKLLSGFGVVMARLRLVGGAGLYGLRHVGDAANSLTDVEMPGVIAVLEA